MTGRIQERMSERFRFNPTWYIIFKRACADRLLIVIVDCLGLLENSNGWNDTFRMCSVYREMFIFPPNHTLLTPLTF